MPDAEPTVAGYRRTRVLRRDALGEVYHAIHEKTSEPVCLRVITSPEGMNAATWGALRYRLVGTLLSLQQIIDIPRMEAIQGVGEVDEGIWVVTDYLDGTTLEDRRQTAGPTAFSDALALLRLVAEALDQLHERGLIHGWLSAERVLVARDNDIRLLGVGLGIVPGCSHPKYTAPEFEQSGPTRAADIYAFGVLLRKVIGAEQVTLAVKAVMDRLTAADPEKRYRHALDAVKDLEQGKIPGPVGPTVPVYPTSRSAVPEPEEDSTPTVVIPPRGSQIPADPAPKVPSAATTSGTATTAVAPEGPVASVPRPNTRGSDAVMPATAQNRAEKIWAAAAVVILLAVVVGLFLLLKSQNNSAEPATPHKSSANGGKKPTDRKPN